MHTYEIKQALQMLGEVFDGMLLKYAKLLLISYKALDKLHHMLAASLCLDQLGLRRCWQRGLGTGSPLVHLQACSQ